MLGCARLRAVLEFWFSRQLKAVVPGRMIPAVLGIMMFLEIQILISEALLKVCVIAFIFLAALFCSLLLDF